MKAGDKVLVKDDHIADLYGEGPLNEYVELYAGCEGIIDHFDRDSNGVITVCISFYDQYYVIVDEDDFGYDGIFMVNYTPKHKELLEADAQRPLFHIIKDRDN